MSAVPTPDHLPSTRPVFLVSTGAWHPPALYTDLQAALASLGYECVAPRLPSLGLQAAGVNWEADRTILVDTAAPFFAAGREVVLVGHSYGGVPAGAATELQGVAERAARGETGGFRSVIFLAGFAIPVRGWDLVKTFGGKYASCVEHGELYTKNKFTRVTENAWIPMFSDCSEEEARRALTLLEPHSQDASEAPCNFVASDITIPKTYVVCEKDLVVPPAVQEGIAASTPGMKVARLDAGHDAFLGKSAELAALLVDIAEGRA